MTLFGLLCSSRLLRACHRRLGDPQAQTRMFVVQVSPLPPLHWLLWELCGSWRVRVSVQQPRRMLPLRVLRTVPAGAGRWRLPRHDRAAVATHPHRNSRARGAGASPASPQVSMGRRVPPRPLQGTLKPQLPLRLAVWAPCLRVALLSCGSGC